MLKRLIPAVLLSLLVVPTLALAQDEYEEERGQLGQLIHWRIDPSHVMDFEAAMTKMSEAAEAAGITQYRWAATQSGFEYMLYYPVPNMAYFDDPDQFWRAFAGSPGEAMAQEAMGMFMKAAPELVSIEVVEGVPAWTYVPEGTVDGENPNAKVHSFWLKPGDDEAFDALVKEFMAFFKEVGHSYPIYGSRVRFGDASRVNFLEWFDSQENYYGINDLEKKIEAKGMGEQWQELLGRLGDFISRSDESDIMWRADLSYWPST